MSKRIANKFFNANSDLIEQPTLVGIFEKDQRGVAIKKYIVSTIKIRNNDIVLYVIASLFENAFAQPIQIAEEQIVYWRFENIRRPQRIDGQLQFSVYDTQSKKAFYVQIEKYEK